MNAPQTESDTLKPMSYDLAFWCDPIAGQRDPQAVYESLQGGQAVEGLGDFSLDATLASLAARFPGMDVTSANRFTAWERSDNSAVIEFSWSSQHLVATARGDVGNDDMNAIIDICVDVGGARLYDPQTGERFDSI